MDCKVCCTPDASKDLIVGGGREKMPGLQTDFYAGQENDPGLGISAEPQAAKETKAMEKIEAVEEMKEPKYVQAEPGGPPKAPKKREILVQLTRSAGQDLGLDVDYGDTKTLQVIKVKDGIVKDWNDHHPELQVAVQDRIVEVNGQSGSTDKIISECQSKSGLAMTVQKNGEFTISLDKEAPTQLIGLDIDSSKVLVIAVKDGPVQQFNSSLSGEYEEFAVKAGDRIIEANGMRGPEDVLKQLQGSKRIDLLISRES